MKRFCSVLLLMSVLAFTSLVFAVGSVTPPTVAAYRNTWVVEWQWTAGASGVLTDYSIPYDIVTQIRGAYVVGASTVPSATHAPTSLYDLELTDQDGIDVFAAALHDRSATLAQFAPVQNVRP